MKKLQAYIKQNLGIQPEIKDVNEEQLKVLPLYITSLYRLFEIELYQHTFILVEVKQDFTTNQLMKHLKTIGKAFGARAIAHIVQLEAYKRNRLIEKHIPFIIPDKQMYLPDLLIDLKEFGSTPKETPVSMSPATQFLLLYHLQVENLEGMNLKTIADKLAYNAATITRAAYYLHNMGLCVLQGSRNKLLHFEMDKKDLWKAAEPLMNNPVRRKQYYSGWIDEESAFKTNNNALAHYSDLNDDIIKYFAVSPVMVKFIGGVNLRKAAVLEGNVCIEEWKYNPSLLTKDKYVDPLSLYLCFRDEQDERIEMALEQIMEQIKW